MSEALKVGDKITILSSDGRVLLAVVEDLAPKRFVATKPWSFFRWYVARPQKGASAGWRRGEPGHSTLDTENVQWVRGWHHKDSPVMNALRATRALT